MKFYLIAGALLLAVLGGIAALDSTPSSAPSSSGSDDSSMKTLKID
jgi:hypothetical protein